MRKYITVFLVMTASMYQVSAVDASVQFVSANLTVHAYAEMVGEMVADHSGTSSSSPFSAGASAFCDKQDELGRAYVDVQAGQNLTYGTYSGGTTAFVSEGELWCDYNFFGTPHPGFTGVMEADSSLSLVFSVSDQAATGFLNFGMEYPFTGRQSYQYQLIDLNSGSTILNDVSFPYGDETLVLGVGTYQLNATWAASYSHTGPLSDAMNAASGPYATLVFEPNPLADQNVPELASFTIWGVAVAVGLVAGWRRQHGRSPASC